MNDISKLFRMNSLAMQIVTLGSNVTPKFLSIMNENPKTYELRHET